MIRRLTLALPLVIVALLAFMTASSAQAQTFDSHDQATVLKDDLTSLYIFTKGDRIAFEACVLERQDCRRLGKGTYSSAEMRQIVSDLDAKYTDKVGWQQMLKGLARGLTVGTAGSLMGMGLMAAASTTLDGGMVQGSLPVIAGLGAFCVSVGGGVGLQESFHGQRCFGTLINALFTALTEQSGEVVIKVPDRADFHHFVGQLERILSPLEYQ